ncbi:hypothetical protein [Kocuria aegyptia]|uniref:Uncharacterized protein n=1 Tax=Kocuria aegyptia TaxID=330943 RepID=A0ABP4W6Z8_9MICC
MGNTAPTYPPDSLCAHAAALEPTPLEKPYAVVEAMQATEADGSSSPVCARTPGRSA